MAPTRARSNELLETLVKGGLKAADCTFSLDDRWPASYEIRHHPTDSLIIWSAAEDVDRWRGSMQSGTDPGTNWRAENWPQLVSRVGTWARETAEWAITPDLWSLGAAALPDAPDNTPFTAEEQAEIAKRLDGIYDFVRRQFALPDDQLAAIGQAVEELKEASERVGRKDWKLMLYGAFVSLGLEHAVQTGVVETVFRLAVEGLGHIFGAGGLPMVTA